MVIFKLVTNDQVGAQNHTESGVCVRSMTVPAVRLVSRLQ
jgi:hypothetical protein